MATYTYLNDENLLKMLEHNLEVITDYMDAASVEALETELGWYIDAAKEYITREGITLADVIGDAMLITMYAGWLFERRKAGDSYAVMPRMLRWNLNNRLFSEHVSGTPEIGPDPDPEPTPEPDPEPEPDPDPDPEPDPGDSGNG